MNKSVLFQLGRWDVGGVERVTVVVANELVRRGWTVAVSAFEFGNRTMLDDLDSSVFVCELKHGWLSSENRRMLAGIIRERKVSVVVNQWCVPYKVTRFLRKAIAGTEARLVAFHHNQPNLNKRILDARNPLVRRLASIVTAVNLRMVYDNSDAYVVLSESFVELFRKFIHKTSLEKVCVIPNPLTITSQSSVEKENIVLYVGRLEETQKRVSRVVEMWRRLCGTNNEWKLVIAGDGPDRRMYENVASGMPRIEFTGFVDPAQWYAKAKILVLTSDFEGFGLVLVEAMAAKCVPVALGSYPAVYDIIKDSCGKVVPTPFNADGFASEVASLMADERTRTALAENAYQWSRSFTVGKVVDRYEALFTKLSAGSCKCAEGVE